MTYTVYKRCLTPQCMADKGHSAVEVSGRPVDFANRETAKGPVSKFPVVNHRPQGTAFEADTGRSTSEVGMARSAPKQTPGTAEFHQR